MQKIKENIYYIGVNDHDIDLFEGMYDVPAGMAYNSYLIEDEKIAVIDSVDRRFGAQWLENIAEVLGEKSPDYLIIQHMEPDHSACIAQFVDRYPEAVLVGNAKTFAQLSQFFGRSFAHTQTVTDRECLSLGSHSLTFVFAPMVHWPEVMLSYESSQKVLFSADAFGKFGALDIEDEWACEARRYYFGIVGKYGAQVQALLKKAAELEIETICPLHGPILEENLSYYIDLYDIWSGYRAESEGVTLAYTSVYGNTEKAVLLLRDKLEEAGIKVALQDLARTDMAEAVEDAFRYDRLVLATTTYNGDIFPYMRTFVEALTERGYQNRRIGLIENGSWAPMAARVIKGMLEKSKNITLLEPVVTLKSAMNDGAREQIDALAAALKGEAE